MARSKVAKVPSRQEERDRAIKLYTETRLPANEIGAMFGVSRTTVHNWLRAAGVPKRGAMGPRRALEERETLAPVTAPDASDERRELAVLRADHAHTQNLVAEILRQLGELREAIARLDGELSTLVSIATTLANRPS